MPKTKQQCCNAADLTNTVPDSQKSDDALSKLAWAIAHPARVRILRILLTVKSCVCGELVEQLPLAQSTVSQHLKILKESGLIQGEIDGPKVCYCVNRTVFRQLKDLVDDL